VIHESIEEEVFANPFQKVFSEIKECKDQICQANIKVQLAGLKQLKNISSKLVSQQPTSFMGVALVLESAVVPTLCKIFSGEIPSIDPGRVEVEANLIF
jgi:hypothetical protein